MTTKTSVKQLVLHIWVNSLGYFYAEMKSLFSAIVPNFSYFPVFVNLNNAALDRSVVRLQRLRGGIEAVAARSL